MKTITYDETLWKLVPVEPTAWMQTCIKDAWQYRGDPASVWAAGVNSAPQPPAPEAQGDVARDAARWRYLAPRYTGCDFDWMPSSEDARDGKTVAVFNMGPDFSFSVDIAGDIDAAMQKGGSDAG